MHIAQLLPELDFGGVERGTVDLANELIDQSHQSSDSFLDSAPEE